MTDRWRRQDLRVRLTIWYAGALLVLLLIYGGGVLAFVWRSLSAELDQRLREDYEVAELMLERSARGEVSWRVDSHHEGEELEDQVSAEAWSPDGELLFRSDAAEWMGAMTGRPGAGGGATGHLFLPNGMKARYLQRPSSIDGLRVVVRVIRSEERMRGMVKKLALIELLALPLGAVLAGFGGYALAKRLLAPLAHMADRADAITAERLFERLPVDNPDDELGQLAEVFNRTFARLDRSFQELRRFSADASHELRTPLTSIRSVGEVALRGSRDEGAYREAIGSMLEESDRLAQMVDTLLTLSRLDDGRVALKRECVDFGLLAREVVDDMSVLAEEKEQSLSVESADGIVATADREVLRRAFVNLVDNAIKYSPDGSSIRVVVRREQEAATVQVIDKGCGIPLGQQEQVFERFYRVDKSRSREIGGTGLGLPIARWAVEVNGGTLNLESREGEGSVMLIRLPIDPGCEPIG